MPTVPPGTDAGASAIVGDAIVSAYAFDPVNGPPLPAAVLSVAVMVKLNVPPAVGIPESAPADVSVTPAGSDPAVTANVYGPVPPDAEMVSPYDAPIVPPVNGLDGDRASVAAAIVDE